MGYLNIESNGEQDSNILTSNIKPQSQSLTNSLFSLPAIMCESSKGIVFLPTAPGIKVSHGDEDLIRWI